MFTGKPSSEGHVHIGMKSYYPEADSILKNYCNASGIHVFDHNLDLNLVGELSEIANEPLIHQHDLMLEPDHPFQANLSLMENLTSEVWSLLVKSLGNIVGYAEAESLIYIDHKFAKDMPKLDSNFFECVFDSQQIIIDTTKQYFEFHWTVPLEFVSLNIEVFKKSGLKTVGFEKNGKQYLVLTTLVPTWKDGLTIAQKVDNLQYGDWKLEVKKYYSQDMSQWKFLMTTIKH
jgi:hypothetical protein